MMLCPAGVLAQPRVLDSFDDVSSWKVVTSEAVSLKVTSEENGRAGHCIRLDYDFTRGSGYGIIRKEFSPLVPLGENYRFSYTIRGEGPSNTVEFKLIDETGDNVWWTNQTNFPFQSEWKTVTLPKRKIVFAWGPAGADVPLKSVRYLEFAITSYNGGKGTVWLDELTFEELPAPQPATDAPKVTVSSATSDAWKPTTIAPDGTCQWHSDINDGGVLTIEFAEARELGGIAIEWLAGKHASDYDVLTSLDGKSFATAARVRDSDGGRDYVQLPDTVAKSIRIDCMPRPNGPDEEALLLHVGRKRPENGLALSNIRIMPIEFGDSPNALLATATKDAPRGAYPRQFLGEGTFWTIAGASYDDEHEVLVDEGGAIEVTKSGFSLEPMVFERALDKPAGEYALQTWANGSPTQALVDGYLPAPIVRRMHQGLALEVRAVVDGGPGESTLLAKYTLTNTTKYTRAGVFNVLIRPYQVNPVYQWLNTHGGVGQIHRLAFDSGGANVDGTIVLPLKNPTAFGAARFEQGEVVEHILRGSIPKEPAATDPGGLASGVLSFRYSLKPDESLVVPIAAGLHKQPAGFVLGDEAKSLAEFDARFGNALNAWRSQLDRVQIQLPRAAQRLADTVKANLAYILINRDGPAIHPGSRSYERAWIRDGSLTSAALLAFGFEKEATEFADWFGAQQYDNGKVPCCVDRRGPDPVPENDSHGQYIWLVLNVFRHTGDSAFLARHYPRVLKAVEYIQSLRAQRSTPEYRNAAGLELAKFGMMPESISHEGYSAKPMHSYWDASFTSRGLKDAATIASLMGDGPATARLKTISEDFDRDLEQSVAIAMKEKAIDYLPGCVELGDFDATSTTVAIWPCGLRGVLPDSAFERTFDKYWQFFQDRAQGRKDWVNYTPYEHRVVGSMIMLGHRDRAHEMWDWFFEHQRPTSADGGWRHWAEVVWKDARTPKFIGDMPHTWVGSDYINAFRSLWCFERADGAMILGAGLPLTWGHEGASIKNLRTPQGMLDLAMRGDANSATLTVGPGLTSPPAGIWLAPPEPGRIRQVLVNDAPGEVSPDGLVRISTVPAKVELFYQGLPR